MGRRPVDDSPLTGPDDPRHGTPHCYQRLGCRCARCKAAWVRHDRKMEESRARRLGPCTVDGCWKPQHAKGLCKTHYSRSRRGIPLDLPVNSRPVSLRVL